MTRHWPEESVALPPGRWIKNGHTLKFVADPVANDCGTTAAYSRHLYRGEPTCEACREAHRADVLKRRPPTPRDLKPHGTHAAFNRHKKHGEEPCDECRAAENDYQQQWRNSRKDAA